LDFRQSGYVPQKPSKTITTKLGDCKDLSALFVTLANHAGLNSELVLVLTNDNGRKINPLPNIGFNHCIVKVDFNGKEHFMELTDNYAPFNTMPTSLYQANALVVSFDRQKNTKDRKSTRLNSSHVKISYAVFCLKKKKKQKQS